MTLTTIRDRNRKCLARSSSSFRGDENRHKRRRRCMAANSHQKTNAESSIVCTQQEPYVQLKLTTYVR